FEMADNFRVGYPLEASLSKTGIRVREGLLAARQVGEDEGCLPSELCAFARQFDPNAEVRLRQAVGRSHAAIRFAAALARLLRDRSLTLDVVEHAGRLAAEGSKSFLTIVNVIIVDMENGAPFHEALQKHSGHFDKLYCRFVQAANGREQMRSQ